MVKSKTKLYFVPVTIGIIALIYKTYRYGWDTTLEGLLSWIIGLMLLSAIAGILLTLHFGIDLKKVFRRFFQVSLAGRTLWRILSSLGLLLILGFSSLKEALDLWSFGSGTIGFSDVFKTATIGAINEGFSKSFNYFPNLLINIQQGNAGTLILDLFLISILFVFIFIWVWIIADLFTGEKETPI